MHQGRTLLSFWKVFLIAFSVLLPLINPLGSALVFLGLVGDAPPKVLHSLARRIAINNIIFLAVFEVLGATILNFFGISLPIVQLSGGLVVAAMGWTVLNERSAGADSRNKAGRDRHKRRTRYAASRRARLLPAHFSHYLRAGNAGWIADRHRAHLE